MGNKSIQTMNLIEALLILSSIVISMNDKKACLRSVKDRLRKCKGNYTLNDWLSGCVFLKNWQC